VSGIRRVAAAAWWATYGDSLPETAIDGALGEWYGEATVERAVQDDEVVYVVADADGIVGYAGATGDGAGPDTACLASVYVTPERWDEGVGTALLRAVAERLRARGFERLRATVLAENDIGRAFYDRRGFDPVDSHEERIGGTACAALVVERPLPGGDEEL
jgi:ribosomal protein S18 acetylase RimI-like enzyme